MHMHMHMHMQGAKHVTFWSCEGEEDQWVSNIVRQDDNALCVCFARSYDGTTEETFTGMQCGDICTWDYGKIKHRFSLMCVCVCLRYLR
jgi:hypothetical protein